MSHDIDADELRSALAATAAHRGVRLGPLSQAVKDLALVRRDAYIAHKRRLGVDAFGLPEDLTDLVDRVVSFADPVLAEPSPAAGRVWNAARSAWS